jgi:hypothetical protein
MTHRRHRVLGLIAGLGLALGALAGLSVPARAIHDVDHRYVVLGYVLDGAGRPLSGANVWVVREKTGLSYPAKTDARGFYVVIVHVHDEDVLGLLRVTTRGMSLRIEARFNPVDRTAPRGTRVDFEGSRAAERQALFQKTLDHYLARR